MLRCLAEDTIYDKYGIEIEHVYKYMEDHEEDNDDDSISNSRGSNGSLSAISPKKPYRGTGTRLLERMSIFTIDEADENNDSIS